MLTSARKQLCGRSLETKFAIFVMPILRFVRTTSATFVRRKVQELEMKWSLHILKEVEYCAKSNTLTLRFDDGEKAEFSHADEIDSFEYQVKSTILVCWYRRSFAPNKWWLGGICQVEKVGEKNKLFGISKITNASHTQYNKPFAFPSETDTIEDLR